MSFRSPEEIEKSLTLLVLDYQTVSVLFTFYGIIPPNH
jgi:hypothetical protein